jgi:hypothetical protein
MGEVAKELPAYIAVLREVAGHERAISIESLTGKEAAVGDEFTSQGAEWRIVAIEPGESPRAARLVCERVDDAMASSGDPPRLEDTLALHLRVLRAIVQGRPTEKRIDQALALAKEVYESVDRRSAR